MRRQTLVVGALVSVLAVPAFGQEDKPVPESATVDADVVLQTTMDAGVAPTPATADAPPKTVPDEVSWFTDVLDDLAAAWARGEGLPIVIAMVMVVVWLTRKLGKKWKEAGGWRHKLTGWTLSNTGGWALNAFWSGLATVWMQWQAHVDLSWRTALWAALTATMAAGFHTFGKDKIKKKAA